ncbi:MAG TPA: FAD-dependent oxidoreductase [Terriglobales bacterium]|nr:FAD-dependent oxidoreductase [Terriglobales bacterium]
MPKLSVNQIPVEVPEGAKLLQAVAQAGVQVPTLCHHKALTPYGACRLCIVEVQAPGRPPAVQASCSYPALEGLSVLTHSERVVQARRIVAELLLARCPEAEAVRRIAADLGVHEPRIEKKNDDCIYCGLCVRVCQERMGRSAIGFSGRGPRKKLEPPFGKHNPICWTCGACNQVCPTGKQVSALTSAQTAIPIPNPYNLGLDPKPAVSILYAQAVPNKAVIDPEHCIHTRFGACGICQEVCEAKAIDYEQKEERVELNVGAVVLTPGYELVDARLKPDLGYGRFPNVITALEFERILSASGPYSGRVLRPSDQRGPKRIAFLQCVGSRDADRDYCSSVCCMYATKEAILAKEHLGEELQCDIFFMDLRAFGKGFEHYYLRAKELGVRYIRSRVPILEEVPGTHSLLVRYLGEGDKKLSQEYDLVVLSVGMRPPKEAAALAERFGIALNPFSFCSTSEFRPAESSREGIYVAGPFTEPKDIPETVVQASAAAALGLSLLKDARGMLITPKVYPPEREVAGEEPRIGVFVCHCGTNIAGVVNVPAVVQYAQTLPNVVYAENNLYTCSNDTQERIKEKVSEHGLNRVVVASCTPRTHEALFRNTIREQGLNPYLFEMANIRDQCSWVHMHEPEKATEKAKDLLRMAVAKARLLEPLRSRSLEIQRACLVIGGGLAGMSAALAVAGQGFDVFLVEKEAELGGSLRTVRYLLNGEQPQEELRRLVEQVRQNEKIHLFLEASIESMAGSIGDFHTKIAAHGETTEVAHGTVIVASGAAGYRPQEYLYGQRPEVLTQWELEQRLEGDGSFLRAQAGQPPKSVVMIQCVGSRTRERAYCSRVCCTEAIKNALRIKELSPETHVSILYRDIRTYGFHESYYTLARQKGVVFARYDEERKPEVSGNGEGLQISVYDQVLGMTIGLHADLVVLSAATVANPDNPKLAQLLKVPLTEDGFFLEAHRKLRPVDFATDGIFLCGAAHSPMAVREAVAQAAGAAARAGTILSRPVIDLEATVSHVVEEACDGCAYCVDPCPFHAITLIEYQADGETKKRVKVDEAVCKGCGTCMATCPKNAIFVWNFRPEQLLAEVHAALRVGD